MKRNYENILELADQKQYEPKPYVPKVRTNPRPMTSEQIMRWALENPVHALRQMTKGSLFRFIQCFWPEYSEDEFIPNWHIREICKELEKVARRVAAGETKLYDLIINVPPGTTKTATVSIFFPVWCWVNWYWMRFITTSHSDSLSLESAEYSRDIIRSEKFKLLFPEIQIKQDKDTKSNFRIVQVQPDSKPGRAPRVKQGGGRVSTSVGAKVTGFHAHLIIPDDLVDPKGAISEAKIREAVHYLDQTLSQRKVDKRISTMIMIMQRLSQEDPTGHLLEKKKDTIRHICLPGEIINYRSKVKPERLVEKYVDGLLDPVRMPLSVLQEMEADLGQYGYAGQVGQNPTPPEGGMFKVDHFQMLQTMIGPVNIIKTVRFWDKAGTSEKELKKGQKAAYTAGVKMCITNYNKIIIMDVKRGRWGTDERERIIRETAEADGVGVEQHFEQEPGSGGKDSAKSTIKNLMGYHAEAHIPEGNKVARADPYSVQVNNGNVLLLVGDWNEKFKEEYRDFPFATFKDQVDAGSGGFKILTAKRQARVLKGRRR